MKRAGSPDYFSSDEEHEAFLAAAVDDLEQTGGQIPSPLFAFDFSAVGQRRRWRNVVQGQSFRATLRQLWNREPTMTLDVNSSRPYVWP